MTAFNSEAILAGPYEDSSTNLIYKLVVLR